MPPARLLYGGSRAALLYNEALIGPSYIRILIAIGSITFKISRRVLLIMVYLTLSVVRIISVE
jgi:hypothetical protein